MMEVKSIADMLDKQIAVLEEVQSEYAGRTIENIIDNLKSRRKCYH